MFKWRDIYDYANQERARSPVGTTMILIGAGMLKLSALPAAVLATLNSLLGQEFFRNPFWSTTIFVLVADACVGIGVMLVGFCLVVGRESVGYRIDRGTVRLRLMWSHQFQFIGVYRAVDVAAKRPEVERVNLEVVQGGSPSGIDPRATVAEGVDDIGITSASALLEWYHMHQGGAVERGRELVPLAVIFERSPACLIYKTNRAAVAGEAFAIGHLEGRRFSVIDDDDPAVIELRALLEHRSIEVQWRPSDNPIEDLQNPLRRLEAFDASEQCEYRVGYIFNEGLLDVATPKRGSGGVEKLEGLRAELLSEIFKEDLGGRELYADVLFVRRDSLDDEDRRDQLLGVVDTVMASYRELAISSGPAVIQRVHDLMGRWCKDWLDDVCKRVGLPENTVISRLLTKLKDSCGDIAGRESRPLGSAAVWNRLERVIEPSVADDALLARVLETVDPVKIRLGA